MAEQELLKLLAEGLKKLDISWMLTGSMASNYHGTPRNTHDIDVVISIGLRDVAGFVGLFPKPRFYLDERVVRQTVQSGGMFSATDNESGIKLDFWMLRERAFDGASFHARSVVDFAGVELPIISPADLIVQKLWWAKESGGSEKQFNDAKGVYELNAGQIDQALLDHWAMRVGVSELLTRLRAEAEPL